MGDACLITGVSPLLFLAKSAEQGQTKRTRRIIERTEGGMRTAEELVQLQEETKERIAARKLKRPLTAKEKQKKCRDHRRYQRKKYHAKVKEEKRLKREAASKIRAEKLAGKAVRRALWEQKKSERELKKAARLDPIKRMSKTDAAYYRGWNDAMRVAAQSPCTLCARNSAHLIQTVPSPQAQSQRS